MHISRLTVTTTNDTWMNEADYPKVRWKSSEWLYVDFWIDMMTPIQRLPDIFLSRLSYLNVVHVSSSDRRNMEVDLYVFRQCSLLKKISIENVTVVSWNDGDIRTCTNLKKVIIRDVYFHGTTLSAILRMLPSTLEKLTVFYYDDDLKRQYEHCTDLLNGLDNLSGLEWLSLNHIGLNVSPNVLECLSNLQRLDINLCNTLTLSDDIQYLTSLESLYIKHCTLPRPLSDALYELTNVTTLRISSCNYLEDDILYKICNSPIADNLRDLNLEQNHLRGHFPSAYTLSRLQSVKYICLNDNYIHGTITTDHLDSMPNLKYLYIRSNDDIVLDDSLTPSINECREDRLCI